MNKETTYGDYYLVKEIDIVAKRLGFILSPDEYGGNRMALFPEKDSLPALQRNRQVSSGSINHLYDVLCGWEIAEEYYTSLGLLSKEKIKEKEDEYRERRTSQILKTGKEYIGQ